MSLRTYDRNFWAVAATRMLTQDGSVAENVAAEEAMQFPSTIGPLTQGHPHAISSKTFSDPY